MNLEIQTIKKTIDINAPKEKVWEVLLLDKYTLQWYEAFGPGSHAETDWQLGSKAIFKDSSKEGIIGTIVVNRPAEVISIEYQGVITKGQADYDSMFAQAVKGCRETYRLLDKDGRTQLSIDVDFGAEYCDMMSEAWENALQQIKKFSEAS